MQTKTPRKFMRGVSFIVVYSYKSQTNFESSNTDENLDNKSAFNSAEHVIVHDVDSDAKPLNI